MIDKSLSYMLLLMVSKQLKDSLFSYSQFCCSRLLTKLVNEKRIDWDKHLFTVLFSYRIAYKVATCYTPY